MENNVKQTKSAGGVVINKDGLVLVVNSKGQSWSLPKGHIDEGESVLDAAKREIYEESGINQLELLAELGNYQRPKIALGGGDDTSEQKTIFMFLFKTDQSLLNPIDPENPEARWVNKNEVAELLTHRKDKEFFLSITDKIKE
jgi:ADP-ribose pyrophosphatase YjhB (NUDIX family)